MKRSGKKMNPKTKRLLIISLAFLVVGAVAMLLGVFTGPSVWAAWDGKKLITSNYTGTFEDKRETEPFSSIYIDVPSAYCTIKEGASYSIDMKSCLPGVKPVVKVENGVLSIQMEDYQYMTTWQITPFEETLNQDNSISITVPAGTKLDEIRFQNYEEYSQSYDLYSNYHSVTLIDIKAARLNCEAGFYDAIFNLNDTEIDNINVKNINSIYMNGLKADSIQLGYSDYYYLWYRGNIIQAKEVTANSFAVNFEGANKNRLLQPANLNEINEVSVLADSREIRMEDSVIGNIDLMSCTVSLLRVETQKATIFAKDGININNCTLKGETILRSAGTLSMGLEQSITDFSGTAMASAGYMNGPVTELADFGTPEYEHGFVTDESKSFGTQIVKISNYEYSYLSSRQSQMMESEQQDDYYDEYTTMPSYMESDADHAKFRDYISITQDYEEENYEERFSAEVYNKKAVSYFVNAAGEKTYIRPNSNLAGLKVNGETYPDRRYQFGSGPNKLDTYSIRDSELKFGY